MVQYDTNYALGDKDADVDVADSGILAMPGIGRGTFLLGRFSSSIVIPSNFVIPTTGASPFFTNSYMPIS